MPNRKFQESGGSIIRSIYSLPIFPGNKSTLARETEMAVNTLSLDTISVRTRIKLIKFLEGYLMKHEERAEKIRSLIEKLNSIKTSEG